MEIEDYSTMEPPAPRADGRTNVNDGELNLFTEQGQLDLDCIEVFFKSMLKPVNENDSDIESKKNFIVRENFSFEPLKRIYLQDFYKSLLANDYMYDQISVQPVNNYGQLSSNMVNVQSGPQLPSVARADVNSVFSDLGTVEIGSSSFHSSTEFAANANSRTRGCYDTDKLKADNEKLHLFLLGQLEKVFDEEEQLFRADMQREHYIISLQSLSRRLTELFARLSNLRLSLLFWTDEVKNYSKQTVTAALDIFYNLMSRISEAHRLHLEPEDPPPTLEDVPEQRARIALMLDSSPTMAQILADTGSKAVGLINDVIRDFPNCEIAIWNSFDPSPCVENGWVVRTWDGISDIEDPQYLQNSKIWSRDAALLGKMIDQEVVNWQNQPNPPNTPASKCHKKLDFWWGDQENYNGANQNEGWDDLPMLLKSDKWDAPEGADYEVPVKMIIAISDEPIDNYTSVASRYTQYQVDHFQQVVDRSYPYQALQPSDPRFWQKEMYGNLQHVKNGFDEDHLWTTNPQPSQATKASWRAASKAAATWISPSERSYVGPEPPTWDSLGWHWNEYWQFNNNWAICRAPDRVADAVDYDHTRGEKAWSPTKNQTAKVPGTDEIWGWKDGDSGLQDGQEVLYKWVNGVTHRITVPELVNLFKSKKIGFYHVYCDSPAGKSGGVVHPEEKRYFLQVIKERILDQLEWDNVAHGYQDETTPEQLASNFQATLRTVLQQAQRQVEDIRFQRWRQLWNAWNTAQGYNIVLKWSRAAWLNKAYADSVRPAIFVNNLVSTMMAIVSAYNNKDKATPPTGVPKWKDLENEVAHYENNAYTWFARTGQYTYSGDRDGFNIKKGGDYTESFTGIHLHLLPTPNGEDSWNQNVSSSENLTQACLKDGLEKLALAFKACFADQEVMKTIKFSSTDGTNSGPSATDVQTILGSSASATRAGKNTSNIGDLHYALTIERIIGKVYEELCVASASYALPTVPRLNVDVALRFLTDNTIKEWNDLESFRVTYSDILKYTDKILQLCDDHSTGCSIAQDTRDILTKIVTTVEDGQRKVNPNFKYLVRKWSLCPWRGDDDHEYDEPYTANQRFDVDEKDVGGDGPDPGSGSSALHYGVNYSLEPAKCPFAHKVCKDDPEVAEQPLDCSLHYQYTHLTEDADKTQLLSDLECIPSVCPCKGLVEQIRQRLQFATQVPTFNMDSETYLHALFKTASSVAEDAEERGAMGYTSSSQIGYGPADYTTQYHSNVRLVYLDQIINLAKDLFRINQWIAFNEPYLKISVQKAADHYYGTEEYGSFEPVTCYRFSNFHALNAQDNKAITDSNTLQFKYFARTLGNTYVTAVNRDLSGETTESNQIWTRSEELDNRRCVRGTTVWESNKTYPYYSASDVACGVVSYISGANKQPTKITRSSTEYEFYKVHLMDELVNKIEGGTGTPQINRALATFEVYVKRFRPIFLPNPDDLFQTQDRGPNGEDEWHTTGWAITPHKYQADTHFTNSAVIVPMNMTSHNAPRGKWFHELDYAFHRTYEVGGIVISGYFVEPDASASASSQGAIWNSGNKPPSSPEYTDFHQYFYRDWMYPVSMCANIKVDSNNHAYGTMEPAHTTKVNNKDLIPNGNITEPNDWVLGKNGDIPIYKSGTEVLVATQNNLKYFDLHRCMDGNIKQNTAVNANWLYITTPGPDSGIETSQCNTPLPWVFFHSSRGGAGQGPSNWCHGCGGRTIWEGHENSFNDAGGTARSMRFFAVDAVMTQNPINMVIAGHFGVKKKVKQKDGTEKEVWEGRIETPATTDCFYKGFYDPSYAGTNERWHTHGSLYYGWGNDPNDSSAPAKQGSRPDKYYRPYFKDDNHNIRDGLSGNSLGSDNDPTKYLLWNASEKKYQGSKDSLFVTSPDDPIVRTLVNKPMTWSVWNVLRQSIWNCYNEADLDYDANSIDRNIDRTTIQITPAEIELKTRTSIREMYREWYKRFTYQGQYTSQSLKGTDQSGTRDHGKGTDWPYKEDKKDPSNYWAAQRLNKGKTKIFRTHPEDDPKHHGQTIDVYDEICNVEWTNLVADVMIMYNEVSDTHDSCLTFYTGGHPNKHNDETTWHKGDNPWRHEFRGGVDYDAGNGAYSRSITDLLSGTAPFRYALDGVDMCRNIMSFIYRGYNSSVPESAGNDNKGCYQCHSSFPQNWQVSRKIKTYNLNGTAVERITKTANGTEYSDYSIHQGAIYGPAEENDTEGCDSNFIQRLMVPLYPNWEDLHDDTGKPLYPDAVTDDQYKQIVFCLAPMTYYNAPESGNGSDFTDDRPAQMGERQMAFCISQLFMGEDAEKITSAFDVEFFSDIAQPTISITAPNLGHDYKPGDPPWGQALVTPANSDPSHWQQLG